MTLGRTIVATSLKMYFSHERTLDWVREVAAMRIPDTVEAIVLPSFLSIPTAVDEAAGTKLHVGAQNLWSEDVGAFTGEVSGAQLHEIGARFVEVGHAERERLFGEDEPLIAAKLAASWRNQLVPILCLGELDEGDPAAAAAWCTAKLTRLLDQAGAGGDLIVAYEPVWAIGATAAASAAHVRTVAAGLRTTALDRADLGDVRVIYGGSAGPGLLESLAPEVDGLFLGRFAHDTAALNEILREAESLASA